MPPKAALPKNPRAAFKPPRPVNGSATDQSSAPKRHKTNSSHTQRASTGKAADTQGSKDRAVVAIQSDSDDDDNGHGGEISDADVTKHDANNETNTSLPVGTAIPPQLLARLLHEHFKHDDTRITKEAMTLFGRYIDLFTREAIARAISERRETSGQGRGSNTSVDFLEVEDLERLVPQLLLDFQ